MSLSVCQQLTGDNSTSIMTFLKSAETSKSFARNKKSCRRKEKKSNCKTRNHESSLKEFRQIGKFSLDLYSSDESILSSSLSSLSSSHRSRSSSRHESCRNYQHYRKPSGHTRSQSSSSHNEKSITSQGHLSRDCSANADHGDRSISRGCLSDHQPV